MDLPERLLGSPAPAVVGVIGSGGKSSIIALLARKFSRRGERVLVSTTTRVYPFPGLALVENLSDIRRALSPGRAVFLGRRLDSEGKLEGPVGPGLPILRDQADRILIEGDGARRHPLKIHLPRDPALPSGVDLALMILGASALGRAAGAETIHRFGRAPVPSAFREGEPIEPDPVARMALAPEGYRGKAGGAPLRILVNQADENPEGASALAASLRRLWTGPIIMGSARRAIFEAIAPAPARPALILLAAGGGRRWPGDKLRARLGRFSVLEWSLRAWRNLALEDRILVARAGRESAARAEGFRFLLCEGAERGMSESLRCGLEGLPAGADGVVIALADMPALRPDTLRRFLSSVAGAPGRVHRLRYRGRSGHPVYIPRARFGELRALSGDRGPRDVIDSWEPIELESEDEGVILDLDRPADAGRLECLLMEERGDDEAR